MQKCLHPSLSELEIDISQVGRIEWPAGVRQRSPWTEPRQLSYFELWFIWSGHGWVEHGGQRWTLHQGSVFWFRPNVTYEVQQDPGNPLGINHIGFDLMHDGHVIKEAPANWPIMTDDAEADLAETVTRRIVELFWQCYVDYKESTQADDLASKPYFKFIDDEYEHLLFAPLPINILRPKIKADQSSILAAESLFRGLLMELMHQHQRSQLDSDDNLDKYQRRLISRIAMRIQHNPADKFSTAKLAEECGYSPDYFTRVFKKIMHCNPQRYQVLARVNRACQLLRESDLLVKQIALQLGYSNEYFFSRQFKSVTGKTPSQYQKRG